MADGEIRIEITGDARDFRRALAGVSDDIGKLQKQSLGLGNVLKGALSAAAGFLAANVIQDGLRALSGAIGGAISKAADLESELNFLQAVSGATGEQMRQVATLAKQLGADVTIPAASALDAAKAMTELAKAGLSVEQSMAAAKGSLQLAAAGQLDAARAAEIVAGALNAFGLAGDQAIRVADLLAAAANASAADVIGMADSLKMASSVAAMSGRSIEETITALSLMANAGIQGSDAGTSLKTMFLRLVAPTKDAKEKLNSLGISLTDVQGRMLPLRDLAAQFATKLSKLTEEERNYILTTVFGSDAIRAANIVLMAGVDAYDQMYQAVTKANAATELAAARTRGLKGAQEALANAVETLGLSFGEKLTPILAKVGFALAELLTDERLIAFVETLAEKVGDLLANGFALVRDVISQIDFSTFVSTVRMAGEELGRMFQPLLAGLAVVGAAIVPILQGISGQIQILVEQGIQQFSNILADLKPVAQDTLHAIGELFTALAPHIQNVLRALAPVVLQIGNALLTFARTFGAVIREALQTLTSFIRAIAALLRGDIDGFVRYLGDSVKNLRELITTAIRGAVEMVGNLIGVNLTSVLSFIERINNALLSVRNLGLNVAQAVSSALSSIRLPFGAGGQQQQQTTQNVTNNYVLNVNAVSSQGVMSDFELMRRLGWR
ncbi:MAG: phage tail tape measure protein [Chloroflexi bacterium]|nr:phage tail tape measure protein [Chloroflexota bacterium]